jgi:internalin A
VTEQSIVTEKSKRRWYQFSLRSLLVFVVLVSIAMSWLGVRLARARKQREAVEAIEKAGGNVEYEDFADSLVPQWARAVFGKDFFFDVIAVWVGEPDFGDDEAAYLKRLTNLTHLSLSRTQVTDAGLEHLEGLTNLISLDLSDTQVTDAGLEHLKGLTSLTVLGLSQTQITDAGLEYLEGLTNLTQLALSQTQITDAGLEHLEGLINLTLLYLNRTQVTTQGVERLRQALPNCDISFEFQP